MASIDEAARRQHAEYQRQDRLEMHRATRVHLDHWRAYVREQFLDEWLRDTAQLLGRSSGSIQLLDVAETYVLQDADVETGYLAATGHVPRFARGVPSEHIAELNMLWQKLGQRMPKTPVYLLRGMTGFWMTADESEPGAHDAWGNASSYFGAVEAFSDELFARSYEELVRGDDVSLTIMRRDDVWETIDIAEGVNAIGDSAYLSISGSRWCQLLADERSD